jgi:hypothetical protein
MIIKKLGRPTFGVKKFRLKRLKKIKFKVTVSELARILNVTERAVRYWQKQGLTDLDRSSILEFLGVTNRIVKAKKY